jgi:hypothetical protein
MGQRESKTGKWFKLSYLVSAVLKKDGLWNIVSGSEIAPVPAEAFKRSNTCHFVESHFSTWEYPIDIWKKIQTQFQRKTWANKLLWLLPAPERWRFGTRSHPGNGRILLWGGDSISEEDRVVHLLASLSDSFNMLVTALEANAAVPKMEVVTEWLLYKERKLKEWMPSGENSTELVGRVPQNRRNIMVLWCHKLGHIYIIIPVHDDERRTTY